MTHDDTKLTIRRATPDDADALARLRWEFRAGIGNAREAEDAFVARCARWMRARLGYGVWRAWVVESGGELVGTAWLELIEKMPNPVTEFEVHGYVTNVYLREHLRGHGAGSRLLSTVLDECAAAGVHAAVLWPTERSRPLYARFGFEDRGEVMIRTWDAAHAGEELAAAG
ncbi:MAG TPA: GNAT family N-acetyltransferase [Longimicrobium sp.]|nr:GNAT family N-acetyltransferase [Longimicrobium sp.]